MFVYTVFFSLSELLEAPLDPKELEAVTKAKILYRSCMNECESSTHILTYFCCLSGHGIDIHHHSLVT